MARRAPFEDAAEGYIYLEHLTWAKAGALSVTLVTTEFVSAACVLLSSSESVSALFLPRAFWKVLTAFRGHVAQATYEKPRVCVSVSECRTGSHRTDRCTQNVS